MERFNKKSGFTLLEVIIVIIIIGVLASLALPRFFSTVEFSRSGEAMNFMSSIRQSVERCYASRSSFASCSVFTQLDLEDPANAPNVHFVFTIPTVTATSYVIQATRNTRDGGNGADSIRLTYPGGTGAITRVGTGAFQSIQ